MNNLPTITIAICTYNRADYLRDTLHDLSTQRADPKDFEILVVNNNSTDHTFDVCEVFAKNHPDLNVHTVIESNQGLSFARNRCVEESSSNYILYIDDDVHLENSFVETALGYIKKNPDINCVGGRIFVSFDGEDPNWIPDELMPMFGLHDLGEGNRKYPATNFPRGGNMMIKKDVFLKYGGFDTDLGRIGSELLGSEEKEFFDRLRKNDVQLHYVGELKLWHRIGPARLQTTYLKKQSIGIGRSERLRVGESALQTLIKFVSELLKWGGSLFLALGYLIRRKSKAARFLLQFRFWVMKGFLSN